MPGDAWNSRPAAPADLGRRIGTSYKLSHVDDARRVEPTWTREIRKSLKANMLPRKRACRPLAENNLGAAFAPAVAASRIEVRPYTL